MSRLKVFILSLLMTSAVSASPLSTEDTATDRSTAKPAANLSYEELASSSYSATANAGFVGPMKIASGATPIGTTAWQPYAGTAGVFVDVNTSAAGFSSAPNYITSIGGNSSHWATTGASSVYNATNNGFRVYIRYSNGAPITPAVANSYGWHIMWVAVGK